MSCQNIGIDRYFSDNIENIDNSNVLAFIISKMSYTAWKNTDNRRAELLLKFVFFLLSTNNLFKNLF